MEISVWKNKITGLELKSFFPAAVVFAAWIVTGLTLTGSFDLDLMILYSGLSLVLLGVLAYFWNALDSPAGETWRNVIGAGIFVNLSAAILVLLNAYTAVIIEFSVLYWIAVPGYGFMVNANFMQDNSRRNAVLAHLSSIGTVAYIIGFFQLIDMLILISTFGTGLVQGVGSYLSLENHLK